MDKLISLELAIKALTGWETDPTDEEIEYTLRKLATDKNVGTTISRQQAIDAVTDELDMIDHVPKWVFDRLEGRLKQLPSAQPEQCDDAVSRTEILRMINCINDHHAITPYKSVGAITEHLTRIASNLPPVTPEQHLDEWCADCKEYDKEKHSCPRWDRVIRQTLADAQPAQRTEKCMWCERLKERNLRIEYYWIDQEGCTASFSEPHIVATGIAKFCPNCGAKITEGDAE